MDQLFDEFSKSLAESLPRRELLRRLGAVFAGAVLGPLGLQTAWAHAEDPCKAFCKCHKKTEQSQCLTACQKCKGDTSRLGGSCGSYVCCSIAACHGVCSNLKSDPNCGACGNNCRATGETCCGHYCADLAHDVFNCGRCGNVCPAPVAGVVVACVSGACVYECAPGFANCNGTCIPVNSDPLNCGACGNVCPAEAPNCSGGTCSNCLAGTTLCNGICTNISFDPGNCGACGAVCDGETTACFGGVCQSPF
jgi:hypothetical protein